MGRARRARPGRAGRGGLGDLGAELGGALAFAVLGSIGVAIYRGALAERLPADVPAEAAAIARDTLGSAVAVVGQLPDELGAMLDTAREAFVQGCSSPRDRGCRSGRARNPRRRLAAHRAAGPSEAEPELDAAFAERGQAPTST